MTIAAGEKEVAVRVGTKNMAVVQVAEVINTSQNIQVTQHN
jgi:hypothetical protein